MFDDNDDYNDNADECEEKMMFHGRDDKLEEDLYADRDIDNDNLIDGLDFSNQNRESQSTGLFGTASNQTNNSSAGCLVFILALPMAILLLMLI
jgi:hypothetical protein